MTLNIFSPGTSELNSAAKLDSLEVLNQLLLKNLNYSLEFCVQSYDTCQIKRLDLLNAQRMLFIKNYLIKHYSIDKNRILFKQENLNMNSKLSLEEQRLLLKSLKGKILLTYSLVDY